MIDESDRDSDTFITFGCSIAVFALIFSKQIKSQGEIPCDNTNKIIAYMLKFRCRWTCSMFSYSVHFSLFFSDSGLICDSMREFLSSKVA